MKIFSVRLMNSLYAKLKNESEQLGISMNSIIILALKEYFIN